jgi:apolipoprotein D and lipocalin family protein
MPGDESFHMKPSICCILLAAVSLVLGGCASSSATHNPPPVVAKVDLARYQGEWVEAARLPMVFQNGCVDSSAEYRLKPDGLVSVVNRCSRGGRQDEVRGTASVVDPVTNAKLEVRFDTWFGPLIPRAPQGNYWILSLSRDYSLAAVGTPDRKCLWVLARKLPVDPARYAELVNYCRRIGYPVDRLIVSPRQR